MQYTVCGVVGLWLVACGHPSSEVRDAPEAADAMSDVALDSAIDAVPDAPPDAPSTSPRCTTAPALVKDVSPSRIGIIARSGNVLYVETYQSNSSNQLVDSRVLAIDLTTNLPAAPDLLPSTPLTSMAVWAVGDDVYATEYGPSGTIWRLHPGSSPVAVVTNRVRPFVVTSDGVYLYWSEGTSPGTVQRRLLTGGAIEPVMTCDDARNLAVDATNVYCGAFLPGRVWRAPKAGGGTPVLIATAPYGIVSMKLEGSSLYFVTLNPELFRVPLPDGPETSLNQLTELVRYLGLAVNSDSFYMTSAELRRMDRTTLISEPIYSGSTWGDPVLWNDDLYFVASDPQSTVTADNWILHCVD